MFDKLCRLTGTVRLRTGGYTDGKPGWTERQCIYWAKMGTFRDAAGTLQSRIQFYCKGLGEENLDASAVFVDAAGDEYELEGAERLDNLFDNQHEFWLLTAVR